MSSCHTPDVISIKAVGSNTPWNQELLKSKGEGSLSWLMDNNQVKIKEFWNSHLLQRAQWTILCNHGNLTFRAEKKNLKRISADCFPQPGRGCPWWRGSAGWTRLSLSAHSNHSECSPEVVFSSKIGHLADRIGLSIIEIIIDEMQNVCVGSWFHIHNAHRLASLPSNSLYIFILVPGHVQPVFVLPRSD